MAEYTRIDGKACEYLTEKGCTYHWKTPVCPKGITMEDAILIGELVIEGVFW